MAHKSRVSHKPNEKYDAKYAVSRLPERCQMVDQHEAIRVAFQTTRLQANTQMHSVGHKPAGCEYNNSEIIQLCKYCS